MAHSLAATRSLTADPLALPVNTAHLLDPSRIPCLFLSLLLSRFSLPLPSQRPSATYRAAPVPRRPLAPNQCCPG